MISLRRISLRAVVMLVFAGISWVGAATGARHAARAQQAPPSQQQPAVEQPTPPALARAPAQAPLSKEVEQGIAALVAIMESAERSVESLKTADEDLGRMRDQVEHVIAQSAQFADRLRPRLASMRDRLLKLGSPPAAGAPAEMAPVAAERRRLEAEIATLDGAVKTLELTWVKARQTIDRITDMRLAMFTRSLTERMSSPMLPSLWREVAADWPPIGRLLVYVTGDWMTTLGRRLPMVLSIFLGAIVAGLGLGTLANRWHRRPRPFDRPATYVERAGRAVISAPINALPAMAAALVLYIGFDLAGLLYYPSAGIAAVVLKAVLTLVAVRALLRAVLSPNDAGWRLVDLDDRAASEICQWLMAIASVYTLDVAMSGIGRVLYLPLSLTVLQSVVASLAYAGLLIMLLRTRFTPLGWRDREIDSHPRHRPISLKAPLWLLAVCILVATLTGYVALARFVAQQLVMTGVVLLTGILLYFAIRAFTRDLDAHGLTIGRALSTRYGLEEARRNQLARLLELALTLAVGLALVPMLLLQWGLSAGDIRNLASSAIFGFEIGQFRISLARILFGLLLFTGLLFATRLLQRWLRQTLLSPSRVDVGIAHSIDTAVGYVGIALGALLAVSYAGLDITNLAIVAGALSVGIGFGLQSIVNNFVSGLILLVERPIKVGDWVVVGDQQGNVRRISVRATEIETFDKASLIVPNSELITGRVLNWTHRNTLGRITIRVGVGYDADVARVKEIMEAAARDNPRTLTYPPPKAILEDFAASALTFALRFQISDVTQSLDAQHEVRAAIFEAFKREAIAVPYNQIDVHMRDLDGIRAIVQRAIEERARNAGSGSTST